MAWSSTPWWPPNSTKSMSWFSTRMPLIFSLFLVITYGLKLFEIHLSGSLGYWFCMFLFSEGLLSCGLFASYINLMFISIERYLKVVHSKWSKKKTAQVDDVCGNSVRVDQRFYRRNTCSVSNKRCDGWHLLRVRSVQKWWSQSGAWHILLLIYLLFSTSGLYLLLCKNSDGDSSPGTRNGRPQSRRTADRQATMTVDRQATGRWIGRPQSRWIKRRSGPIASDSNQRG